MDTITATVAGGRAELVPEPGRASAWTLFVEGVEQSHVDLYEPARLAFDYVRRIAAVLDAVGRRGAPLRVLHLGGGAMTLPRYVAETRPGSTQRVVEVDGALADFVRTRLPLPTGVDVTVDDARAALAGLDPGAWDVAVGDVYNGAAMPTHVATAGFATELRRVLAPGGLYLANVTDLPPLAFGRRFAATLREVFGEVAVLGEPGMLRGRKAGNLVVAAGHGAGRLAGTGREVLKGPDLAGFTAGAGPFVD